MGKIYILDLPSLEQSIPIWDLTWEQSVPNWPGWEQSVLGWEQSVTGWELTWEQSVLGCELTWKQSVPSWELTWEQSMLGWELTWEQSKPGPSLITTPPHRQLLKNWIFLIGTFFLNTVLW